MRDFIIERSRPIIITIFIITLLITVQLSAASNPKLLIAVLCGYIAAVYYFFLLSIRLYKSILLNLATAKRSIQFGVFLRIVFLLLCIILINRFAKIFFIPFIAGFFIMYIVLFINLIIFSYKQKNY